MVRKLGFGLIGLVAVASIAVGWSCARTTARPPELRPTGNAAALERIARKLAALPHGDPEPPPATIPARALKDITEDDFRVRIQAVLALGSAGDEAGVQPLCAALADDVEVSVRVAAAAALGKLGWASSVRCLKLAKARELSSAVQAQIDRSLGLIEDVEAKTVLGQREALFRRMKAELDLSNEAMSRVRAIFDASGVIGQGNPFVSSHPMTRAECREVRAAAKLHDSGNALCGSKYMVPLFDPSAGQTAANATACIDQYEFPSIPCEYPVVYARANEAAELCEALGKRLCDAHEWEGACAGAVRSPDVEYAWGNERPLATWYHNVEREIVWSYGPTRDDHRCATWSRKTPGCVDSGWRHCGTNTWPAGAFPACVSPLGVYDMHGNAAEHMNLPMTPEELTSRGGTGHTEMKGSWFATAGLDLYEDDCRWRAKDWHPSRVMDPESHRNYHLSFRCCRDVLPAR